MDWCWESENELFLVAVHYIGLTHIRYASDNPMNLAFPNIVLHPIKQDTLETSQFPHEIWDLFTFSSLGGKSFKLKSFSLSWLSNPSLIKTNHCKRQRSKAQIYNVQMYKLQMYMVKKMNNIGNTAQSSKLRRKTKNLIFHVFLTNPSKDDWLKLNQFALHWWNRGIWFLTEHSNDSADSLAVGPERKSFFNISKMEWNIYLQLFLFPSP